MVVQNLYKNSSKELINYLKTIGLNGAIKQNKIGQQEKKRQIERIMCLFGSFLVPCWCPLGSIPAIFAYFWIGEFCTDMGPTSIVLSTSAINIAQYSSI